MDINNYTLDLDAERNYIDVIELIENDADKEEILKKAEEVGLDKVLVKDIRHLSDNIYYDENNAEYYEDDSDYDAVTKDENAFNTLAKEDDTVAEWTQRWRECALTSDEKKKIIEEIKEMPDSFERNNKISKLAEGCMDIACRAIKSFYRAAYILDIPYDDFCNYALWAYEYLLNGDYPKVKKRSEQEMVGIKKDKLWLDYDKNKGEIDTYVWWHLYYAVYFKWEKETCEEMGLKGGEKKYVKEIRLYKTYEDTILHDNACPEKVTYAFAKLLAERFKKKRRLGKKEIEDSMNIEEARIIIKLAEVGNDEKYYNDIQFYKRKQKALDGIIDEEEKVEKFAKYLAEKRLRSQRPSEKEIESRINLAQRVIEIANRYHKKTVSLQDPVGEEGESTIGDFVEDKSINVEADFIDREKISEILNLIELPEVGMDEIRKTIFIKILKLKYIEDIEPVIDNEEEERKLYTLLKPYIGDIYQKNRGVAFGEKQLISEINDGFKQINYYQMSEAYDGRSIPKRINSYKDLDLWATLNILNYSNKKKAFVNECKEFFKSQEVDVHRIDERQEELITFINEMEKDRRNFSRLNLTRDVILLLGFFAKAGVQEVDAVLGRKGLENIYPRSIEDATLMVCLNNQLSYLDWKLLTDKAEKYIVKRTQESQGGGLDDHASIIKEKRFNTNNQSDNKSEETGKIDLRIIDSYLKQANQYDEIKKKPESTSITSSIRSGLEGLAYSKEDLNNELNQPGPGAFLQYIDREKQWIEDFVTIRQRTMRILLGALVLHCKAEKNRVLNFKKHANKELEDLGGTFLIESDEFNTIAKEPLAKRIIEYYGRTPLGLNEKVLKEDQEQVGKSLASESNEREADFADKIEELINGRGYMTRETFLMLYTFFMSNTAKGKRPGFNGEISKALQKAGFSPLSSDDNSLDVILCKMIMANDYEREHFRRLLRDVSALRSGFRHLSKPTDTHKLPR